MTTFTYAAFYKHKRASIVADTLHGAKEKAVTEFKVPQGKEHQVHVYLAQRDEEPVVHTADF